MDVEKQNQLQTCFHIVEVLDPPEGFSQEKQKEFALRVMLSSWGHSADATKGHHLPNAQKLLCSLHPQEGGSWSAAPHGAQFPDQELTVNFST